MVSRYLVICKSLKAKLSNAFRISHPVSCCSCMKLSTFRPADVTPATTHAQILYRSVA